jgi:nitrogenase-stabilizing/protective protein
MTIDELETELAERESAEDFLGYFDVHYDPAIVHVNRLHILQRFHEYLVGVGEVPADGAERWALYASLLAGAYQDFVESDAQTEKVFRVFRLHEAAAPSIDLAALEAQLPHAP